MESIEIGRNGWISVDSILIAINSNTTIAQLQQIQQYIPNFAA